MTSDAKYWPFETLPLEQQIVQHKREITFLEQAYRHGYNPYVYDRKTFAITLDSKGARIIARGREHWEVLLGNIENTILSAYVKDFDAAANASLDWLRGVDVDLIADRLRDALSNLPKGMKNLSVSY